MLLILQAVEKYYKNLEAPKGKKLIVFEESALILHF
jgi:hypothetical protein